jgi:Na+-transporting NADH:ubiquinone oxidoreductase subunit A
LQKFKAEQKMPTDLKVKKGLNLNLKGDAERNLVKLDLPSKIAVKPPDFYGTVPKLIYKKPDVYVKAGDELFYSKYAERTRFVSPVSGKITAINRGAKRRVLSIEIEPDKKQEFKDFGKANPLELSVDEVKEKIFSSGCGAFIKQRPYDVLSNADDTPKSIFISTYNSAPLGPSFEFILNDKMEDFQTGLDALTQLTKGKVYVGVDKKAQSDLHNVKNAEIIRVSGPHPAGNVGVQIHNADPINAGEVVWTLRPEDVAIIGHLFNTGEYKPERTIAITGNAAPDHSYYRTIIGAPVAFILPEKVDDSKIRIISGDVLTGEAVEYDDYINFYSNELCLIPEGNTHRMFGWLPFKDNNIPSMHKTSFSWLFPKKKFDVNTNTNGEERALVVTGEMEEVMPMDIYPMQLLKACMVGDIEKMENLGIYEVIPEDFALVEYVNTSKINAQQIIREALDRVLLEVG